MAFSLTDYTDLREVERGGFARIFLAVQKSLDRKVIIKQLERSDDPGLRKRFEKEARSAAALEHPNIVRIYDFGVQDNACYIVMEYVEGLNLEQMLQNAKISPEACLAAALQAFYGLRYSHEKGIVHRDVKPANILVANSGIAKIADFGLALDVFERQSMLQSDLTSSGLMVGTPHYMSPEQVANESRKDRRIDIWAAGVLCYRILTGRLPFDGDSLPSLVYQIAHVKQPFAKLLAPCLPERLAVHIDRCLEKDSAKRPDSLDSLIELLTEYLRERGMTELVTFVGQCVAVVRKHSAQGGVFDKAEERLHNLSRSASGTRKKTIGLLHITLFSILIIAACYIAVMAWLRLRPQRAAVRIVKHNISDATDSFILKKDNNRSPNVTPAGSQKAGAPQQKALQMPQKTTLNRKAQVVEDTTSEASVIPHSLQADKPSLSPDVSAETLLSSSPSPQKHNMGELIIITYPLDAKIYIDGTPIDRKNVRTPIYIVAGRRTLLVRREGYCDERREVTIRPGSVTRIKIRLQK